MLCALAHWCSDGDDRARELELEAASLAGEGHERELNPPRLRIALEEKAWGDVARHLGTLEKQGTELPDLTTIDDYKEFVKSKGGDGAKPSLLGRWFGGKG